MYTLEKYYKEGFDSQLFWETKYSQEHIAGRSSEDFKTQKFWPILEKHLQKGKRYLDVGCGIGGWVLFLNEQDYLVEGVDIAAKTIRALTEYNPDLKLKVGSMTNLPYEDNSFDGLLSVGSLEYVENKVDQGIKEMHRVTKQGAFVFVEAPLKNTLRRALYIPLKKIEKRIRLLQGKKATFSNYLFGKEELKQLFEKEGFEVVEMHPHELPEFQGHYGLYIDWKFLRGSEPYKLNTLGNIVKGICDAISPWIASTGVVLVAKKK